MKFSQVITESNNLTKDFIDWISTVATQIV